MKTLIKAKYLFPIVILLIGLCVFSVNENRNRKYFNSTIDNSYTYSAHGAIEYLTRIKTNQETKTIDVNDVIAAQELTRQLSSKKSGHAPWKFKGPDNIGGRTRALLIDNSDDNLMFAGGVAGGLWRSTTKGQYWEPVSYKGATSDDFANLAIVTIAQSANGDVYFGTGEALTLGTNHGTNRLTPFTMGAGIWKSTDRGETFERLESTWGIDKITFSYVNKIGIDSASNYIYAATGKGLKVSIDDGGSWANATIAEPGYNGRFSSDVKVASDGTVLASINNNAFVKKPNTDEFVLRSGRDESEGGALISNFNVGRIELAFSPQSPKLMVCVAADPNGMLRNIYRSTNGGDSWKIIGEGGSTLFQPFGNQGIYDLCVAINPKDSTEVFIAGLDIWVGKAANTGSLFAWSQVSISQVEQTNPLYVHADQHIIIFDPSDAQTLFVGSDGGVSRGYLNKDGEKYQFKTMNKNYNVTQFYSLDVNGEGQIIGGTQDNGTILMGKNTNQVLNGVEVTSGDGGHVVMSSIVPSIAFSTIYFGGLWRNNDAEFGDWNTFYVPKIADLHWAPSSDWEPDAREGSFVTPIAFYETPIDKYSSSTVAYEALRDYPSDTTIVLPSHTINKAPIELYLRNRVNKGDIINYKDPYGSLFAFGMSKTVWLTRSATNWKTLVNKDWWRAVDDGVFGSREYVTQLAFSADGDHLFFSTSDNRLFRLSNLNRARSYEDACYIEGNPITELTEIAGFGSRAITGISCDPNEIDRVIITLGNYGNSNYVFLCTKATRAESTTNKSNFIDITGNLPLAPAFCSLFEMDANAETVYLGTDMGVFTTNQLMSQVSNTVNWEAFQEDLGPVPTFQIKQQRLGGEWTKNHGKLYVGTHGLGMFENSSYYTAIEEEKEDSEMNSSNSFEVNLYPNPMQEHLNVAFKLEKPGEVAISVYQISGQLMFQQFSSVTFAGKHVERIKLPELGDGVYLIRIQTDSQSTTQRIIKR